MQFIFNCKLYTCRQSSEVFLKTGGFKGVYKGLNAAAIRSAPSSALFFSTYEKSKQILSKYEFLPDSVKQMIAASLGEIVTNTF
jgi:solute carrier family 25 S-adenosylmethionine transporter 26